MLRGTFPSCIITGGEVSHTIPTVQRWTDAVQNIWNHSTQAFSSSLSLLSFVVGSLIHFEQSQVSSLSGQTWLPKSAHSRQPRLLFSLTRCTLQPPHQKINSTWASARLTSPQGCSFLSLCFLPFFSPVNDTFSDSQKPLSIPLMVLKCKIHLLVGVR